MKYYNHQIGRELHHDLIFSSCIATLMWDQITGLDPLVLKESIKSNYQSF